MRAAGRSAGKPSAERAGKGARGLPMHAPGRAWGRASDAGAATGAGSNSGEGAGTGTAPISGERAGTGAGAIPRERAGTGAGRLPMQAPGRARGGFTLAEVAVTIAVVGLALVWMLQALNTSKVTAAYTRNLKLSRELALLRLGQIEAGLFNDELDGERVLGTFADEGYPDFSFEVVIGDSTFLDRTDAGAAVFDNWAEDRRRRSEDEDEPLEQPYERVQVKVVFPPIQDLKNELVLERWLPWAQIHPPEEGKEGKP